ncbi:hypothetical protein CAOG_009451 [Capsaspora owczarzaki ATCC 30864]|uniref:Uncharacterized protein n=1 Tax=Capsaspora owczarzaki (strain ATCC 30864) TaxID=595528 RepID=A0A0D2X180_CAPO3|nr:hypothetical protein CAOG_009451 [Capsaspora owczarzaki ATCC 30864]
MELTLMNLTACEFLFFFSFVHVCFCVVFVVFCMSIGCCPIRGYACEKNFDEMTKRSAHIPPGARWDCLQGGVHVPFRARRCIFSPAFFLSPTFPTYVHYLHYVAKK